MKSKTKSALSEKEIAGKYTYLRESVIRYKKKRVSGDAPLGKPIAGAKQVVSLFRDLQNETKEKLITISLDAKLKIICFEVVAVGSVASIYCRPFEAIRAAIMVNAYGAVLVHNHPSGDPSPSLADKQFTKALKQITDLGGMLLYDHVIIGEKNTYFSFAENGVL